MKPRLLDLFCCEGGAGMGYNRAGWDVVGVDIVDRSQRYPFEFIQADALEYLVDHGHEYDAVHGSPPCQRFTAAQSIRGNEHPDLVTPMRAIVQAMGLPYIIENVPGAPLIDPIELCGTMFGLETYRHRLFESSAGIYAPAHHPRHLVPSAPMGRRPMAGEYMTVVGNFVDVGRARDVMGMEWASREGLREAIPPAYTEYLGVQLLAHIRGELPERMPETLL